MTTKTDLHKRVRSVFVARQDFRCAICNCHLDVVNRPHLDHCHVSGKIRGALCQACNWGLGQFQDAPERLKEAIAYLQTDVSSNPPYPGCDPGFDYVEWLDDTKGFPRRGVIRL